MWKKRFTPIEKLEAHTSAVPDLSMSICILSSSWYHPVVPTTMLAPARAQASMLPTTAFGVVKSMTASTPARLSLVSAAPFLLEAEGTRSTLWPRSLAISATSDPVFPLPNRTKFMGVLSTIRQKSLDRAEQRNVCAAGEPLQVRRLHRSRT